MEQWQAALDRWLTTPDDEEKSKFKCDGDRCTCVFQPDDEVYEIEGMFLCERCADEWLEQQKRKVTVEECYG